jgi:hypothetical protein
VKSELSNHKLIEIEHKIQITEKYGAREIYMNEVSVERKLYRIFGMK